MKMKKRTKGTKDTLAWIHGLYFIGKIDRDTHNLWCEQACKGAKSFEQV